MNRDRFDDLVQKLNDFLIEDDRLYRMGWRGYIVQLWNSIFSRRVLHPIYSEPNLTDQQKDAVCLASDVVRAKQDAEKKKGELTAQFGADGYNGIIHGFDTLYNMFKIDFGQ